MEKKRKTKRTEILVVNISPERHRKLRLIVDATGVPGTDIIRRFIHRYIEDMKDWD